ncbi:MAG: tyrosine-type recombinase/integrase [Streptosporangiaceae bacterium]
MTSFDVRVFAIRRRPGRAAFEVRWRVARRDRSRSFMTRALADSYRAELVRAARRGLAFDPVTCEPAAWAAEPVTVTWYHHAVKYAEMKWPRLAPHSRASLAEALATVTPLLTLETGRRPPDATVRSALYGHAFNPRQRRSCTLDPVTASTLAWLERVSLPVSQLSDPRVIRAALDGLCTRLDGSPAAANTIARKRAVFHGALGYAVELGLLPANPISLVQWRAPRAAVAVNPAAVASPAQVRAILTQVCRIRPDLAAFFGCLYYAALRPEEAVALRRDDLILPVHGRGKLILTAACPRTGSAWTGTGSPYEPRGLKHRRDGAIRVVPIPPVLVRMLRRHLGEHGSMPDGRLFRGARGGVLSESVYGRAWHAARQAALGPELAATALARRPYDLRHAALSLWLNVSAEPAEVAARAGNSARVLHDTYLHCIDSHQDLVSQQIEDALDADPGTRPPSQRFKAGGYTHRRHHPRPCPLYVRRSHRRPALGPRTPPAADQGWDRRPPRKPTVSAAQASLSGSSCDFRERPDPAHA